MKARYYQPELDALRFFAFLCVFWNHSRIHYAWSDPLIDVGNYGLCMFFLLSAFLIVTILLREKEATGKVDLKRFIVRRMLRVWPLYYLVLFGAFALGHFWGPSHIPPGGLLASCLLAGNFYIVAHGWHFGAANPLWSLSVEEQFYLAVPGLTKLATRGALTFVFLFTIFVSYATIVWLAGHHVNPGQAGWPNSLVQFQFFAAGGLFALLYFYSNIKIATPLRLVCILGGLAIWCLVSIRLPLNGVLPISTFHWVAGYLLLLVGTSAIFFGVAGADVRPPAAVLYLGKISYGLYLFHLFYLMLFLSEPPAWVLRLHLTHARTAAPIALVATVATAALSYEFFEKPFLRIKERFETIRTRPA